MTLKVTYKGDQEHQAQFLTWRIRTCGGMHGDLQSGINPSARRCIIGEVRTKEGIQEVELCCTFVGVDSRWVIDVVLPFERVDP